MEKGNSHRICAMAETLVRPVLEKLGLELWDIEYVREGGMPCLRIYIDARDGVNVSHTEAVYREFSDLLDEADPITEPYTLEVSSPGIERVLKTDAHLGKYLGSRVAVRLYKPIAGQKTYTAVLKSFDKDRITLVFESAKEETNIERANIAKISLCCEY